MYFLKFKRRFLPNCLSKQIVQDCDVNLGQFLHTLMQNSDNLSVYLYQNWRANIRVAACSPRQQKNSKTNQTGTMTITVFMDLELQMWVQHLNL